jgi:hypothetical protein
MNNRFMIFLLFVIPILGMVLSCQPDDDDDVDKTPPTVIQIVPAEDSTMVNSETKVVITFSEPMKEIETQGAVTLNDGTEDVDVNQDWSNDTTILSLQPIQNLEDATEYTITIETTAQDANGLALEERVTQSFTSGNPSLPFNEDFEGGLTRYTWSNYYSHYWGGSGLASENLTELTTDEAHEGNTSLMFQGSDSGQQIVKSIWVDVGTEGAELTFWSKQEINSTVNAYFALYDTSSTIYDSDAEIVFDATQDWTESSYSLGEGLHEILFKILAGQDLSDVAYLDDVQISGDGKIINVYGDLRVKHSNNDISFDSDYDLSDQPVGGIDITFDMHNDGLGEMEIFDINLNNIDGEAFSLANNPTETEPVIIESTTEPVEFIINFDGDTIGTTYKAYIGINNNEYGFRITATAKEQASGLLDEDFEDGDLYGWTFNPGNAVDPIITDGTMPGENDEAGDEYNPDGADVSPHGGTYMARLGTTERTSPYYVEDPPGHSEFVGMSYPLDLSTDATVTFWYFLDAHGFDSGNGPEGDLLKVFVDGTMVASYYTEYDFNITDPIPQWEQGTVSLQPSNTEIEFRFEKDDSFGDGQDCLWIDDIVINETTE